MLCTPSVQRLINPDNDTEMDWRKKRWQVRAKNIDVGEDKERKVPIPWTGHSFDGFSTAFKLLCGKVVSMRRDEGRYDLEVCILL